MSRTMNEAIIVSKPDPNTGKKRNVRRSTPSRHRAMKSTSLASMLSMSMLLLSIHIYLEAVHSFSHVPVSHLRIRISNIYNDNVISQRTFAKQPFHPIRRRSTHSFMVISSPDDTDRTISESDDTDRTSSSSESDNTPTDKITPQINALINTEEKKRKRKKYKRKRPKRGSEEEHYKLKKARQAKYEDLRKGENSDLWDFESLFPDPVWDDETILKDLFEISDRDSKTKTAKNSNTRKTNRSTEKILNSLATNQGTGTSTNSTVASPKVDASLTKELKSRGVIGKSKIKETDSKTVDGSNNSTESSVNSTKINRPLTRMVEDRLYGFKRDQFGEFEYDTSLMGEGAVKFRDGVRLGNSLKVNADRLTNFAKKELAKGKLEEAEELYEKAIETSPRDGRAYLGLSRIAQRRRDFKHAKECLRSGIVNSVSDGTIGKNGIKVTDTGANPFLLQALGTLEERMGHLAEAERLYIAAARSRPSHAAAWVALAQLRTRKLRQGPNAGRMCYQTAEVELKRAGLKQSSHVYTAWASLEWKSKKIGGARYLFRKALEIDPRCSAAWNQLGVMEANEENWLEAETCFETVLKYDRRNSRVLQAFAIMETKRPDSNSRRAIGLFEKALKANPRDGGVLQAYALYVAKLDDVDSARDLLKKGTKIDKRHAPLWQAWGVLETRHGTAADARDIFQQGIWACAQSSGGQSGGRHCARLWQAWGVLEAREKDYDAARRCFSRALDADRRNVAAVTAWTLMEEGLGKFNDAKLIFERALIQFGSQSEEKMALWRAYELMESQAGNFKAAQNVYQRSIRDVIVRDDDPDIEKQSLARDVNIEPPLDELLKESNEIEVSRWNSNSNSGFGGAKREVWLNDGSIEGKVPKSAMKKKRNKPME